MHLEMPVVMLLPLVTLLCYVVLLLLAGRIHSLPDHRQTTG